jgi:hypothetical protein
MLVHLLRVQPARYADSSLLGVFKAVHVENVPAWATVALGKSGILRFTTTKRARAHRVEPPRWFLLP